MQKFYSDYQNTDIYYSCYNYSKLNGKKTLLTGDFYLDFDGNLDDDFQLIKEALLEVIALIKSNYHLSSIHMQIFFSGSKGFHLIIPCFNLGFTAKQNLNYDFKKIASYLAKVTKLIDMRIYDDNRLFRVPNSINGKSKLYKVQLTEEQLLFMGYEQLLLYAQQPSCISTANYVSTEHHYCNQKVSEKIIELITKEEQQLYKTQRRSFSQFKKNISSQTSDYLFPCVDSMLNSVHAKGGRNEVLVVIASYFAQKGIDYEETITFLKDWNESHNSPSLNAKELVTTVASAYSLVESGRGFGCGKIMEIGFCNAECQYTVDEEENRA